MGHWQYRDMPGGIMLLTDLRLADLPVVVRVFFQHQKCCFAMEVHR